MAANRKGICRVGLRRGIDAERVGEPRALTRGLPAGISVDNGPEFAGGTLDEWAHARGVVLDFIRPGKPVDTT